MGPVLPLLLFLGLLSMHTSLSGGYHIAQLIAILQTCLLAHMRNQAPDLQVLLCQGKPQILLAAHCAAGLHMLRTGRLSVVGSGHSEAC